MDLSPGVSVSGADLYAELWGGSDHKENSGIEEVDRMISLLQSPGSRDNQKKYVL